MAHTSDQLISNSPTKYEGKTQTQDKSKVCFRQDNFIRRSSSSEEEEHRTLQKLLIYYDIQRTPRTIKRHCRKGNWMH